MKGLLQSFLLLALGTSSLASPFIPRARTLKGVRQPPSTDLQPRQQPSGGCKHGPNSRKCWGAHSIDTNYYEQWPSTGVVREYWLSIQEGICAPDGVPRPCMTANGTVPGPLIWANWGDDIVVHVTNDMKSNGTAIHWHGMHMRDSVEYDGVPGVTQCPIRPDRTLTYKFKATQYGTTWYHSHFSLQYAEGLFGPLVIYGPTTDDYDVDLGPVHLNDWYHDTAWRLWHNKVSKGGAPPAPNNGLINGTNVFGEGGKKFELKFTPGKKHLLRLINSSNDAHFRFSIDGHTLRVVAADLVPIVPYDTQELNMAIGQRYDVIIQAKNHPSGDYWLRSGMGCTGGNQPGAEAVKGIVRYDSSTSDPTSGPAPIDTGFCGDEPIEKLTPHLKQDIFFPTIEQQFIGVNSTAGPWWKWTLNSSSLVLDWHDPTLERIVDGHEVFPTPYNVIKIDKQFESDREYYALVIQNPRGVGGNFGIPHPIHLHGHDFSILSQSNQTWDGKSTAGWTFKNPVRRDTATLPGGGHLAIGFELDNPGAWLVHCHIAWHASQGLSLEFVETQKKISMEPSDRQVFKQSCDDWDEWRKTMPFPQDDSGI